MFGHALRGGLERVLNSALAADPKAAQRIRSVRQKCIRLTFKELPEPITLVFHEQTVSLVGPDYDAVDASLKASLFDVPQLTDAAAATHAIQTGTIALTGDPVLVQQAAAVFMQLDIDWEEALAEWVGDVPAYLLSQKIKAGLARVKSAEPHARVSEYLTEEQQLLASPVMLQVLQADCVKLQQRLEALEQRLATFMTTKESN
ncbi:MAG: SCP2 sterol-binding domain-containing protein [Idiomarina sp.]|nr:SCP2 sterol-binding domain-containing protein [Idiomarina sp.]